MVWTTGLVQKLSFFSDSAAACVSVGPSPNSVEVLILSLDARDPEWVMDCKRSQLKLLIKAHFAGFLVTVEHPDQRAEIQSVSFDGANISPVGMAIHDDFYSITGSGIPVGAQVVFDSPTATVTITPDFIRPHWVLIARLSAAVPPGRNTVRIQGPGFVSDSVPVDVVGGAINPVRVLYPGAPRTDPYTIAFVANPAIEAQAGNTFSADPILGNQLGFHNLVAHCLVNCLMVTEDFLRRNDIDAQIRFVSIFDTTQAVTDANSLAHEVFPNMMETRRNRLNSFVNRYLHRVTPLDVVFVLHGSTTHGRATAWYTTDDATRPGVAYTYDGVSRTHGRYPSIPGSAAIPLSMNQTGLTAIHEFGHAGSDFNNGGVHDLYADGFDLFVVNEKARTQSTDPIPGNFATYNSTVYASDPSRDGLGYPSTWTSYHPALLDTTRPNLMDDYWQAAQPQRCRLDRLTYAWYSDRLNAKVFR